MGYAILLVDDDAALRCLGARVLSEAGYEVRGAAHPAEALAVAAEQRVDVLVTDFEMPQMNGAELVAALLERDGRVPPSVLISGAVDLVLPSQQRLFTKLLSKPFTAEDLCKAVALCIRMIPSRRSSGTRMRAVVDDPEDTGRGELG